MELLSAKIQEAAGGKTCCAWRAGHCMRCLLDIQLEIEFCRQSCLPMMSTSFLVLITCEYVTLGSKRDFANMIKLTLRQQNYPGLSGWAQHIQESLGVENLSHGGERHVTLEDWSKRGSVADLEHGRKKPWAKECRWPLQGGTGKEMNS